MMRTFCIASILLLCGLGFRLYLALRLPNDEPDDGRVYALIARNVLDHHGYSVEAEEPYTPTFIRVPGYPLFLAGIYRLFGRDNDRAVRVAEALLGTLTCLIVGLIALAWAPADWTQSRRRKALLLGIALAAACPFLAIYVSLILTETWATLLAAATILAATLAMKSESRPARHGFWLLTGLLGGAATMFRPDAAMFAGAAGLTMVLVQIGKALAARRSSRSGSALREPPQSQLLPGDAAEESASSLREPPRSLRLGGEGAQHSRPSPSQPVPSQSLHREAHHAFWMEPLRAALIQGLVLVLGFAVALAPWTIRNERVFARFQPIAPADAGMPGEFSYQGYITWLKTWVDDVRYTEAAEWPLDYAPIRIESMPAYAFDSPDEKDRVAALLAAYNNGADKLQDAENASSDDDDSSSDSPDSQSDTQANQPGSGPEQPAPGDGQDHTQSGQPQSQQPKPEPEQPGAEQSQPAQPQTSLVHGKEYAVQMTPDLDAAFGEIARERIARSLFRYYVVNRLKRAASMWFDTHSQYYPFQGELLPLSALDTDIHQQYWLPAFMLITLLYTALVLAGGVILWRHRDARPWLLLLALLTLPRIAFLSTLENPEPRYVVELFAFVAAAGAVALAPLSPRPLLASVAAFIIRSRRRQPAPPPPDLA